MNDIFSRTELLLGTENVERIATKKVILFGVGGVGSWCAEALVRSGIRHLTMVDFDCVCSSNINRQLMVTTQTIGQSKVEVLRERLLQINPEAEIIAIQDQYDAENREKFHLETFDFVIDAIDLLQ
ncbi:MAG: ThiF family adenylyltransferase, partial [Paludibacteraceae bacterium]|nr:ThiF family adenylyltransferase [Paludibacteraceae bacterium]